MTRQKVQILLVFGALALMFPKPAWAYLDPGTGMILVQALIASVAGGFALCGIYWRKLKSVLGLEKPAAPPTTETETEQRDS